MTKKTALLQIYRLATLLLVLGFGLLLDLSLSLFGFPSEQYVHPANYSEIRKSIEFEYEFRTNSQGLRYRELPLTKQSEQERRILVLGDSFVEGWGVEQHQTFTSLLESHFGSPEHPVRFINCGLAGTGPYQYMQALFQVGLKYEPDGVLICIYANDILDVSPAAGLRIELEHNSNRRGMHRIVHALFPRMCTLTRPLRRPSRKDMDIVDLGRQLARKKDIPEEVIDAWAKKVPTELRAALNEHPFGSGRLVGGLLSPDTWATCLDMEDEPAQQRWVNMSKILDVILRQCRARNIEVQVIFIPCVFLYNPESHKATNPWVLGGALMKSAWLSDTTRFQRNLRAWAKAANVPFLDLTDDFRRIMANADGDLNYPFDCHWTPLGHQVAAGVLHEWLTTGFSFISMQNPTRPEVR